MTNAFQKEFHAAFSAPRDQLTRLVERVTNAKVTSLERVTQGYVNEVYRAELASAPTVFVRVRRRGVVSFATEAWALNAARRAGVPAPEVYVVTTLDGTLHEGEPLEVMVLESISGQPLGELWPELGEPERRRVMNRVGSALRSLHSTVVGGWGRRMGEDEWEYADWESRAAAMVRERTADVPVLQSAGLSEAETDALMAIVQTMPTLSTPTPVLCHGDLGMDHLFVDDALSVTGVIDFGAWWGGPRELDFAVLTMYHPDVQLAWLEQSYQNAPFDGAFYRRMLIEQVNVEMGFLAHDLRQGNADYLALAVQGTRATLKAWQKLS